MNRQLTISRGKSRKSRHWAPELITWEDFCKMLETPTRGKETMAEYLSMKKADQDEKKDVGGFVGGEIEGRRTPDNVKSRDLITLDMDNIPSDATGRVLKAVEGLGCAYVIYSTRKHMAHSPRLRVIIPLNRSCTTDEYEPIARKLAERIGINMCDRTTFQASRLMYWPSCCKDAPFVYYRSSLDAQFASADGILDLYKSEGKDWRDVTAWPRLAAEDDKEMAQRAGKKQADPLSKSGLVGAFCKTYTITEAIEKFLDNVYVPVDGYHGTEGEIRCTYTKGSTTGGAIIYNNDLFLYSHHSTDPTCGHLVNAWDLVRMHLYGDMDANAKTDTPVNRLPSYKAMEELAGADVEVQKVLKRDALSNRAVTAAEAFGFDPKDVPPSSGDEDKWVELLDCSDKTGLPKNTRQNMYITLMYDPFLRGIVFDELASKVSLIAPAYWDKQELREAKPYVKRPWTNADDASYHRYMEKVYNYSGRDKLDEALIEAAHGRSVNEIKDYLTSLKWDGVKRIDTLLHDYLGAYADAYTAAVMRTSLVAAVSRALSGPGGVKFDNMIILTGPQGCGKSTFLKNLGKEYEGTSWFSDSLTTFEGKDASEHLQGVWIVEVAELTAFSNTRSMGIIKQFLSKQRDRYRAAYARHTEDYPRRCVFFATTNDREYLTDATGNRRFWPVDLLKTKPKYSVWDDMPKVIDQVWAEAMYLQQNGAPIYLSKEIEALAVKAQEEHVEVSGEEGQIEEMLDIKIPENFYKWDVFKRRTYLLYGEVDGHRPDPSELLPRPFICAKEVYEEFLGGNSAYYGKKRAKEINTMLTKICKEDKWEYTVSRMKTYGIQRGWLRKK